MFGLTTASRLVWPADWLARALANADADRAVLRPDQQVDVGDVVQVAAFDHEAFADVTSGHGEASVRGEWMRGSDGVDGSGAPREGNRIPARHPNRES